MLQGMELTRTNRSGGLTTYYFLALSSKGLGVCSTNASVPTLVLEARREKVQAITLVHCPKTACFVSGSVM